MRAITQDAAYALLNKESFTRSNTIVRTGDGSTRLYLHHNLIAVHHDDGRLFISNCGWESNTTKERLNGILRVFGIATSIYQKDFTWYWHNAELFPYNQLVRVC